MASDSDLDKARSALYEISPREFYEVPGKADVIYELRDYSQGSQSDAERARAELPFLFKPFEVGQKPPPSKGQEPPYGREPTIHEYLDWTVTAASTLDALDFTGFRVLTLLPRYRPMWPPPHPTPSQDPIVETTERPSPRLGGPKKPIPLLIPYGRPISATTIRCGPDYIEVPFFATKPSARGKGYGKALLYAIEDICRFLGLSKILLCSTDDAVTISTWQHLGFRHTTTDELSEWGIASTELVHMTNTVQMVKMVGEGPQWWSLRIRHEGFDERLYYHSSRTRELQGDGAKKRKERQADGIDDDDDADPLKGVPANREEMVSIDECPPNDQLHTSEMKRARSEDNERSDSRMDGVASARDVSETDRNNIIDNSLQQQQSNEVIHSKSGDLCAAPIE